jgi:hypothetical protein
MTVCYNHIIYGPTVDSDPTNAANVSIPYTGKPKVIIRPKYADDGVSVKYYEYELKVSATIYSAVTVLADIEDEIKRIKKILSTPRLMLKMYPVGLGTSPVVNGVVGVLGTDRTPDMANGPLPGELSVTPAVTNQAIDIEWTVTTWISHCATGFSNNLVQFVSELDIDVDEEGNISFLQRVVYESSIRVTDLTPFNAMMDSFGLVIGKSFQGMYQTKSTHQSMDGRTLTFESRYREIPSDSAFAPFTRNIEATDDLSSSLIPDGFYKWHRRIAAKITLPARIHKAWAWVIFKKILAERLRNMEQVPKAKAEDMLKPANQETAAAPAAWYLCMKMKFTNSLYSRVMSFDFEYLLISTLEKLLSRTLIMSRVNSGFRLNPGTGVIEATSSPTSLSDQWVVWDSAFTTNVNGAADYEQDVPVVYTQCLLTSVQPTPQAPRIRGTALLPLENDPDIALPAPAPSTTPGTASAGETAYQNTPKTDTDIAAAYSWADYSNTFEIIQNNDNIQTSYIQPVVATLYQNTSPEVGPLRTTTGWQINNDTSSGADSGADQPETVNRGIATYKVRMRGHAVRAGYRIPTPVLTSVGGKTVERTDQARIVQKQIAQSDTTPVYLAMWDITYNVNKNICADDIGAQLKSSGHPGFYT